MSRKDLYITPRFRIGLSGNSQEYIDTLLYAEVIRDSSLSFVYGEADLSWVSELECSELIVAIVRQAREDRNLKIMRWESCSRALAANPSMSLIMMCLCCRP